MCTLKSPSKFVKKKPLNFWPKKVCAIWCEFFSKSRLAQNYKMSLNFEILRPCSKNAFDTFWCIFFQQAETCSKIWSDLWDHSSLKTFIERYDAIWYKFFNKSRLIQNDDFEIIKEISIIKRANWSIFRASDWLKEF